MKIVPDLTFNDQDIQDALKLAHPKLPLGKSLPNGIDIRVLRAGAISHCYFFDGKKAVGVASVQRDKIVTTSPTVKGIRFMQVGLLKDYRGLGLLYRAMNALCERYRIFASPQMTTAGKAMWINRIKLDKNHVYLIHKPGGLINYKGSPVQFLPIHKGNVNSRAKIAWDGSLQTRLIMVRPKDVLFKHFSIDWKND